MLVGWMAYATLLTACVVVGGVAAEHVARLWHAPRRFVWIAGLLASVVVPLLVALRPTASPAASRQISHTVPIAAARLQPPAATRVRASSVMPTQQPSPAIQLAAAHLATTLEPYALRVWIAVSLCLFFALSIAIIRLRVKTHAWREMRVGGVSVLIAPDVGPAVIGALRPRIVIAEWALALDERKRALMLRHELEHIRAHDPLVLLLAALSIVVFPWNVALWAIVRRLRHSIELDCDRRVLTSAPDASRDYGMLLLLVGARRGSSPAMAAAFAGHRPLLERRIKAMTAVQPRRPLFRSIGLLTIVVVSSLAAAKAPVPASVPFVPKTPVSASTLGAPTQSRPQSTRSPNRPRESSSIQASADALPAFDIPDTLPVTPPDPSTISTASFELGVPQDHASSRQAIGRVLDSVTNTPLANVYVSVVGVQALNEPNWTCSDANGTFRLRVPLGEAWLSADAADHAFSRVTLAAADSVAVLRGRRLESRPWPPGTTPVRIQSARAGVPGSDPLIIVDGVLQPPLRRDTLHLTTGTADGRLVQRDWLPGDSLPRIYIDGVEVSRQTLPSYSSPCVK